MQRPGQTLLLKRHVCSGAHARARNGTSLVLFFRTHELKPTTLKPTTLKPTTLNLSPQGGAQAPGELWA
jgi:hypothetical protein